MLVRKLKQIFKDERGMELVQVAILVAIAIAVGIFFKDKIGDFVSNVFTQLDGTDFGSEIK